MTRRNQRARVIAIAIAILSPAAAFAAPPSEYKPLLDDVFVPIVAATQPVPVGPPATASPRTAIASPMPDVPRSVVPSRTPRPTPTVKPRATSTPRPAASSKPAPRPATTHHIRGIASWYCNRNPARAVLSKCMAVHPDTARFDAYAAAGPRLRVAMGGGVSVHAPDPWRNKIVTVCGRTCQRVKLADWCACQPVGGPEKLIDLYYDVYRLTGSSVKVSW